MRNMLSLALTLWSLPLWAENFPVNRCVNLDQALEAPVEGDWGYVIEQEHITWIAAQGFDAIRLPVKFSAHWDGTAIDSAFQARVDQVVDWALAVDLHVILDLHHFNEVMDDPAKYGPVLVDIWQSLGDHYAGYDARLIFELLNEPTENLSTARAVALFEEIIPNLRQSHPDRWIIIEGHEWAAIEALPDLPVIDDRTVLSFHYYTPAAFTHQQASWHPEPMPPASWGTDTERAALKADFAIAAARGAPLLLGEFGVTSPTDLSERVDWISAVRQAAEDHDIGWCHWGFARGFAIFDDDLGTWLDGMQDALIPNER